MGGYPNAIEYATDGGMAIFASQFIQVTSLRIAHKTTPHGAC
jgi:hypothetical protein